MSDEELHIKIKVDSTEAETKLGNIKDDFKDGAKGAEQMDGSTKELLHSLNQITRINVFDKLFNAETLNNIKQGMKAIKAMQPPLASLMKNFTDAAKSASKASSNYKDAFKAAAKASKHIINHGPKNTADAVNFVKSLGKEQQAQEALDAAQADKILAADLLNDRAKAIGNRVSDIFREAFFDKKMVDVPVPKYDPKSISKATDLIPTNGVVDNSQALTQTMQVAKYTAKTGVIIAGIVVAVAVISKTIKKIKSTIQEINNLWTSSVQDRISTQYAQQLEYLKNYLGVSDAQLETILEEDTETVKALLQKQYALGGVSTNAQITAIKKLNQSTTDLKTAWKGMWTSIAASLAPIVQVFTDLFTIIMAINSINFVGENATDETVENLKEGAEASEKIKKNLMGFDELNIISTSTDTTDADGNNLAEDANKRMTKILGIIQKIKTFFKDLNLDIAFDALLTKINPVLGGLKKWRQTMEFINTWRADGFIAAIKSVWDNLKSPWVWIVDKAKKIGEWFSGTKLGEKLSDFIKASKALFSELWEYFKAGTKAIIAALPSAFKAFKEATKTFFTETIPKWFNTACEGLKTAFKAVGEFFKGIFKGVVNAFIGWLNSGIDGINKAITAWNSIQLFEKTKVGTIGKIPTLAKGGAVYQPTTAIIGEYAGARSNPEIVAPQSIMYETVKNANGDIIDTNIQLARQIIQAISQKDLSVSIGDKDVAEATNRYNNQYRRMTGKALLTI